MEIREHNRLAWDAQVASRNRWTVPVDRATIERARQGILQVVLTPTRPVPQDWFPALRGAKVLCLASGGGQQGPVLAAAGADVTVFDNSPRQLEQDRDVARREGLAIKLVEGDMRDLSAFQDASFDLVFHPIANLFVPEVRPVWNGSFRVLKPGGILLSGFMNPVAFLFDFELAEKGDLEVKNRIPYSDERSLSTDQKERFLKENRPLEFGHSLEDQIGGQLEAGFLITGFYEDRYPPDDKDALSAHIPIAIATRALKPGL